MPRTAMPKNIWMPTSAKGGWFYVEPGQLSVVVEVGKRTVDITWPQIRAALKIARQARSAAQRDCKP